MEGTVGQLWFPGRPRTGQALQLRTMVHIHECSVGPELPRAA